jgi:EpsI family protein
MKRSVRISIGLLLAAQVALAGIGRRPEIEVVDRRLDQIPRHLSSWEGRDYDYVPEVYKSLDADQNLLRLYRSDSEPPVWLYIGYYGTAKGGRTGHLPQFCLPGSGHQIHARGHLSVPRDGGETPVQWLVAEKNGKTLLATYWIQNQNRIMRSGWDMNWNRFVRRIRENRDDGAFVRLTGPADPANLRPALAAHRRFAEALLVALPDAWPVEAPAPPESSVERR